ncbi:arabinogalactan oligomer / maltooligosaccharide transport system substrate-binding protein [Paenibacillus algorifonticola]|uniref:Maltodextrin-binding protein n=1 Tax=Paenibacillus algorifonticola TaxID=684063 RepID=A0A1I2FA26_9BACL|nr:arabinogalactan oligomer / maltooligosaccharide transport system substrate-binding protein [Paenibacillus algorifonticola]
MMKKWLGVLIVCVLVFTLAACGNAGKGSNIESTPEASSTPAEPGGSNAVNEEEGELLPEEGASIVIWEGKTQRKFVEALAQEFTDQYGVPVKLEEVENPDQVTKLTTDGPAGLGADVVVFPHDQIGRAASAGLVLPNDWFGEETASENDPNAVSAVTFEDILYGYPRSVETYALLYNKKLVSAPPKTFDEVIAFSKTFNDPKKNKYTIMWELQQFYYDYAFLATNGGYMFGSNNTDKEDIGLNNEGAVEGAKFLASLKESLLPLNTGDITFDIKKGLFIEGSLAMDINGPWALADYRAAGIDLGVAPLPSISGNPMTSFSGVQGYYVNAFTKYPNASKLFARFLSTKESQLRNFEMNGTIPANLEAVQDPKIQNDEITKAFYEQFSHSTPMPAIPQMASVWGPITAGIADIWDGGKDVKASLDNSVAQIKDAIASQ